MGLNTVSPTKLSVGFITTLLAVFKTGIATYLPATVSPPISAVPSAPNFNLFFNVSAAFSRPTKPLVSVIFVASNKSKLSPNIVLSLSSSLVRTEPTP